MNKPLCNSKVYIDKSPIHGWGVFAREDISSGEIIEEAPVLKLEGNKYNDLHKSLREVVFSWKFGLTYFPAVALGCGSMYNHRDDFTVNWACDNTRNVLVFTANRDIKKGEELFIDYGQEYFQTHEIEKK